MAVCTYIKNKVDAEAQQCFTEAHALEKKGVAKPWFTVSNYSTSYFQAKTFYKYRYRLDMNHFSPKISMKPKNNLGPTAVPSVP